MFLQWAIKWWTLSGVLAQDKEETSKGDQQVILYKIYQIWSGIHLYIWSLCRVNSITDSGEYLQLNQYKLEDNIGMRAYKVEPRLHSLNNALFAFRHGILRHR